MSQQLCGPGSMALWTSISATDSQVEAATSQRPLLRLVHTVGRGGDQRGRSRSWKVGGMLKRPLIAGRRPRAPGGHGLSREKACRMAVTRRNSSARARPSPRQTRLPGGKRKMRLGQPSLYPSPWVRRDRPSRYLRKRARMPPAS